MRMYHGHDEQFVRAVNVGTVEEIKHLITAGADINRSDVTGWTPLHPDAAAEGQKPPSIWRRLAAEPTNNDFSW